MFGRIGPMELIVILIIALLIFGPTKLPQLGRSIGEAIKEFRKGTTEVQKEINGVLDPPAEAPKAAEAKKAEATKE